jgi:pimeloyl-ACP methyl ester carboxylesterase
MILVEDYTVMEVMTMAIMMINGRKMNVIQMNPEGEKTIVMIHGLFTSLSVYYFAIAPRLAKKYHVVLYDLSGHGLSESREEMLTLKNLSEDLIALMAKFKIEKTYVIGYSFGGVIALYTAMQHPNRVERLALIDMPYLDEAEFDLSPNVEANFDFEMEVKKHVKSTKIKIPNQVSQRIMVRLEKMFGGGKLVKTLVASRQVLNELPITELKVPTLLIYGKKSPYLVTGRRLQKAFQNAQLRIGRGDHNIPVQSALWVYWQLRKFFKRRF